MVSRSAILPAADLYTWRVAAQRRGYETCGCGTGPAREPRSLSLRGDTQLAEQEQSLQLYGRTFCSAVGAPRPYPPARSCYRDCYRPGRSATGKSTFQRDHQIARRPICALANLGIWMLTDSA